jgi:hypothetical protein
VENQELELDEGVNTYRFKGRPERLLKLLASGATRNLQKDPFKGRTVQIRFLSPD